MEENKKKKRTAGDVIRTLIMIVALGVFCYSGYQLLSIYQEYKSIMHWRINILMKRACLKRSTRMRRSRR